MSTHNLLFLSRNMKNIRIFYLKHYHFLVVKFSVHLNRRVFVMLNSTVTEKECPRDFIAKDAW